MSIPWQPHWGHWDRGKRSPSSTSRRIETVRPASSATTLRTTIDTVAPSTTAGPGFGSGSAKLNAIPSLTASRSTRPMSISSGLGLPRNSTTLISGTGRSIATAECSIHAENPSCSCKILGGPRASIGICSSGVGASQTSIELLLSPPPAPRPKDHRKEISEPKASGSLKCRLMQL